VWPLELDLLLNPLTDLFHDRTPIVVLPKPERDA
jgi:hypothetical protein